MMIELSSVAHLDVVDDVRSTREVLQHGPPIHRIFDGAVVMAATAEQLGERDAGDLVGEIVAAYEGREGFSRSLLGRAAVVGADTAYDFSMEWQSDADIPMHSLVRVVVRDDLGVVLHAALPRTLQSTLEGTAQGLIESLRLAPDPTS